MRGLCWLDIENSIGISSAFFIGNSVSDQWLCARWLIIQNKEGEVVCIFFIGDNKQQILSYLGISYGALNCKFTCYFTFIKINNLYLFFTFFL
jgi:hypothetical protein